MAGRGPARKPVGTAVGHGDRGQQTITVGTVEIPPRPAKLGALVNRAWADFWSSPVAGLIGPAQRMAVRRVFQLYAEREHCHAVVVDRRVTRIPLTEAVKTGLTGRLVHEHDDEGTLHSFVEVEHEGRVALGSQGQLVLSPWARDLRAIDAEIRQLEDRLGMSPRAIAQMTFSARPAEPDEPPDAPEKDSAVDADSAIIDSF